MVTNRIEGRRALVTGASAGFGRACALLFANKGVDVVLWARREDRLDALRGEIGAAGSVDVRTDAVDVRDREAVLSAGERLRADGAEPDILVNNAGLAAGLGRVHEGGYDDWDRMIDTNIKGLLNVTRCFLPGMVARDRGHVINIGSVAGHMAYPKGNVYNATKFAVRGLSEALNLGLVGTSIRVSSVHPGAARTEFPMVRFSRGRAGRAARPGAPP